MIWNRQIICQWLRHSLLCKTINPLNYLNTPENKIELKQLLYSVIIDKHRRRMDLEYSAWVPAWAAH